MKKRLKKKGFTLIELVIVLAVLAIIALIAIPNFNKVRTDSQKKADDATCETIKGVTQMAIANEYFKVGTKIASRTGEEGVITISFIENELSTVDNGKIRWDGEFEGGKRPSPAPQGKIDFETALSEVKPPQEKGKTAYIITIDEKDAVKNVVTGTAPKPDSES